MLGGFIGQFLPLSGGKLGGTLSLGGNALNMNTGGGGGGGNINMDGGAIFVAGGEFSMNNGSGSGGNFFNADGAYFNTVGGMSLSGPGASVTMTGGTLSLNGGGGSGGGNVLMDGGNLVNANTVSALHFSTGAPGNMGYTIGSLSAGGTATVVGNDCCGIITLNIGGGEATGTELIGISFNAAYAQSPVVLLFPINSYAAGQGTAGNIPRIYVSVTIAGFTVNANATLSLNTTYQWNYLVL